MSNQYLDTVGPDPCHSLCESIHTTAVLGQGIPGLPNGTVSKHRSLTVLVKCIRAVGTLLDTTNVGDDFDVCHTYQQSVGN